MNVHNLTNVIMGGERKWKCRLYSFINAASGSRELSLSFRLGQVVTVNLTSKLCGTEC